MHLDLLKFALSDLLLFEHAPGPENLGLVSEQLALERLVDCKLQTGRIELERVESLSLEQPLFSLSYGA